MPTELVAQERIEFAVGKADLPWMDLPTERLCQIPQGCCWGQRIVRGRADGAICSMLHLRIVLTSPSAPTASRSPPRVPLASFAKARRVLAGATHIGWVQRVSRKRRRFIVPANGARSTARAVGEPAAGSHAKSSKPCAT